MSHYSDVSAERNANELAAIQRVLQAALDRDPGKESAYQLAVIAVNAIYWRNQRLNECERILGEIAMLLRRDMTTDPAKQSDVYSRPECIFNYCPNLGICDQQNSCESPMAPSTPSTRESGQ